MPLPHELFFISLAFVLALGLQIKDDEAKLYEYAEFEATLLEKRCLVGWTSEDSQKLQKLVKASRKLVVWATVRFMFFILASLTAIISGVGLLLRIFLK